MPLRKKILLNVLLFVTLTSGAAIVYRQLSPRAAQPPPPAGETASPPTTQPVDPEVPGDDETAAATRPAGTDEAAALAPDAGTGPSVSAAEAAALVIAGRHDEALEAYEALLARYPDDVAYRAVVDILSSKVEEARRMRGVRP